MADIESQIVRDDLENIFGTFYDDSDENSNTTTTRSSESTKIIKNTANVSQGDVGTKQIINANFNFINNPNAQN